MNVFDINPYIRVSMRSVLAPWSIIKRRAIFDYELIYVENGYFYLTYADKEYKCTKGNFVLIRPGVPHIFRIESEEVSQPHIHFDLTYTPESGKIPVSFKDKDAMSPKELSLIREDIFSDYPLQPFVRFLDREAALKLFFDVVDGGGSPSALLAQKSAMTGLISFLVADNFSSCFSSSPTQGIERQIKDFIDAEQGFALTLSDLEKQFSYDKFYLEKCFKQTYGISIMAYRNKKRMESAKKMLRRESVARVAEKLGFGSIYTFSRAFKLHFGVPPTMHDEID